MITLAQIIDRIKRSALARDSSWALAGSAVGKGFSMAAGIVIARLLGADVFGEYGMIKSTLAYVATFSTFGLGYTATKYIAQCKKSDAGAIRQIIAGSTRITLAMSGIMALVLLLIANRLSMEPHLVPVLRYTALIIVFNAVNTTQLGLLSGFKDFRAIAVNNTIVGTIMLVLGTVLTYFFALDGAVAALFASTVIQCLLNHLAVRRHDRSMPARHATLVQRLPLTKELLSFSLPIALQECIYASAGWLRIWMLATLAGYDELGLYTVSNQWYIMILFVPGVLRNVILSYLSSSADEPHSHRRTFDSMMRINLAATAAPATAIALVSPLICRIYGETFDGLICVFLIMVVTSIFGCMAGLYSQEFISRGRNWTIFWAYVMREYGSIALTCPLLLASGGDYGAAITYGAYLLTHILYCAVLGYRYNKKLNAQHNA